MALNREVWIDQVKEGFYPDDSFLQKATDYSQFVDHNRLHIASAGIDPKVLDDWEFMESLYDLQADPKGNALQIIPFLRRLLGDSYDKVKNGLRGADGRIDGETMGTFLTELFEEMGKAFPNS